MNDNWISVKERLPEKKGWYRIQTPNGFYEAPFVHSLGGKLVWVVPNPSDITHWMPLPEPPKTEIK